MAAIKLRRSRTVTERFWEKVSKTGKCWLWIAHTNNMGYGELHVKSEKSRVEYAHRISWELHFGPIPEDMKVLHKCDTPRCVRPDHLFLGTQKDNLQDAIKKQRIPILVDGSGVVGDHHGMAKLSAQQVCFIRSSALSNKALALQLGVCSSHIWSIRKRRIWKHLQ